MRLKSADYIIVVTMAFLAMFSSYKLFWDKYNLNSSSDKEVLAVLNSQINVVKKKSEGFLSWFDADLGDNLVVNDQIYTYKNSQAQISFKNGSEIELVENTLFKITQDEKKTGLSVEKGIMYATFSDQMSNLEVSIEGKKFEINSSNAKIQIAQNKNDSKITIIDGELELKGKEGVAQLKKNQYFHYDKKSNQVKIRALKIIPLTPEAGKEVFFVDSPKVSFSWKQVGQISNPRLIVSSDRDFKNIVHESDVSTDKSLITLPREGIFYWKVSGLDESKNETVDSGIRNVTLLEERAPEIKSPPDNYRYTFQKTLSKNSKDLVLLEWNPIGTKDYQIELTMPDKQKKVITQSLWKMALANTAEGGYEFRVRGLDKNRPLAVWSQPRKFSIGRIDLPAKPKLLQPIDGYATTIYQKKQNSISLSWDPLPGVEEYHVQIIKGQISVFDDYVDSPHLTISLQEEGKYQWRVRARDHLQRDTEYSDPRSFNITFEVDISLIPENGAKITLKRPNQKVKFEWEEESSAETYLFEVSESRSFKDVKYQKQVKSKNIEVNFAKIGTYYWRTKVIKNGKETWSRPYKVEVKQAPPPERIELAPVQELEIEVKPKRSPSTSFFERLFNAIIHNAFAESFVRFVKVTWPISEDAKEYVLEIYSDDGMKNLVHKTKTTETTFEWMDPKPGDYYYRVAIIDYWGRQTDFSNLSNLKVSLPDKYKPINSPIQILPAHKTIVDRRKESTITFKWEGDSRTREYTFQLASDLKFSKLIHELKTDELETTIETTSITSKKPVYWRILADGQFGQKSISKRRMLTLIESKEKKLESVDVKSPTLAEKLETKSKGDKNPTPVARKSYVSDRRTVFTVGAAPSKVSYELNNSAFDATIDGTAMNSIDLRIKKYLDKKYLLDVNVERQSGEVFTDKSYQALKAQILMGKEFKFQKMSPDLRAGIIYANTASYNLNGSSLADSSTTNFAGVIGINGEWKLRKRLYLEALGLAGMGTMTVFKGEGIVKYRLNRNLFVQGGLRFTSRSFDSDSSEISVTDTQVLLGIGYYLGEGISSPKSKTNFRSK